jgi:hypothetical protein
MRALSLALLLVAATACAGAPPASVEQETEQFLVALDACMPQWFMEPSLLEPTGLAATTVLVRNGDFGSSRLAPFRCVLDAGSDCVRVRECYGLRSEATSGPCAGAPPRCEGNTLLLCAPANGPSPTQLGRLDCTRQGLSCVETTMIDGTPVARCAVALCDGTEPAVCVGDVGVICVAPFMLAERAPLGTTCLDRGGFIQLVGTGDACRHSECVGDVVHDCDTSVGRLRATIDCSLLGQTCTASDLVRARRSATAAPTASSTTTTAARTASRSARTAC